MLTALLKILKVLFERVPLIFDTKDELIGGKIWKMLDIYTDMDWVMCSERQDITHRLKEMKIISLQRTEFKDTWK